MTLSDNFFLDVKDADVEQSSVGVNAIDLALEKIEAAKAHLHGFGADFDHKKTITLLADAVHLLDKDVQNGDVPARETLVSIDRFLEEAIGSGSSRRLIESEYVNAAQALRMQIDNTLSYAHQWKTPNSLSQS